MTKKTRRLLLLAAVPIAVVMAVAATVMLIVSPASAVENISSEKYIIRKYNGMVAVFLPGKEEPKYVTDSPVSCLPEEDRSALEQGLPVYSEEELSRLLEDYST